MLVIFGNKQKMNEIKIPYYEDNSRISNSNIGVFLKKGPKALKEMLDGTSEKQNIPAFEKGTMIHMYLLQPDEFWDNYVILDFEKPTSAAQIKFAELLVNTSEIEPNRAILSAYQASYSIKGKSEDKMLAEGLEIAQKLSQYIEYLKLNRNTTKKIISWADLNMLKAIKANVINHKKANELLFELDKTCETHNEFHINWDYHVIPCKSLLDRIIFDHEKQEAIIVDIKTTSDVYDFEHSIKQFDYIRQLAYYTKAAINYMFYSKEIDTIYDIKHYIIAIQNNSNYAVRVINFTEDQIKEKYPIINDALLDIEWHIDHNKWDFKKEYYDGDGSETFI